MTDRRKTHADEKTNLINKNNYLIKHMTNKTDEKPQVEDYQDCELEFESNNTAYLQIQRNNDSRSQLSGLKVSTS